MKKTVSLFLIAVTVLMCASCSQGADNRNGTKTKTVSDVLNQKTEAVTEASSKAASSAVNPSDKAKADVDLTELSSTMVYSEVYNMMATPDNYIGKTVRMSGSMAVSKGDNQTYYACIIKDATACCSQGIEFVLDEGSYPPQNTDITVYGTFTTYKEGKNQYCQLKNAVLE